MDSLTIGTVIEIITIPCTLYKHSLAKREGIQTFYFRNHFLPTGNYKFIDFIIGGLLANPHWSLLTYYLFSGSSPKIISARDLSIHWFPRNYQLASSVGKRLFCSFLFRDKRMMVRTRSRATSPSHQGSRDTSSNPHRDRQSALVMQTSSAQHVQSIAAAMAELTCQNQELRMEINLRR